jgi:hypothetical protein
VGMKASGIVLGVVLVLVGLLWIGQGLGYVKGSFMTGAMLWTWIGAGAAIVGVAIISLSLRPRLRR